MDNYNTTQEEQMNIFNDLDTSWIEKESKLHSIDKNYYREPMNEIHIHIVYIDCKGSIANIRSDLYPCDSNHQHQYISKERLLKIIQSGKQSSTKKYVLFEMMLYVVELEPQHIQEYVNTSDSGDTEKWCKIYNMVNDIHIPPSIFIFHAVNGLFVFLKELEVMETKTLHSILRISGTVGKKHTKKVRISEHNQVRVFKKHKKTQKHHHT